MKIFKLVKKKCNNSNGSWPKRYRAHFIYPGLISYEDSGNGVVYVGDNALKKMASSFVGKPVVNEEHHDLTPEQAYKLSNQELESLADGVVYDIGIEDGSFDPEMVGWHYSDIVVWNEETKANIDKKGYNISCSYEVLDSAQGDIVNNISYDAEVTDGEYTHLAIVANPRYNKAKITELPTTYNNSCSDEVVRMIQNNKEKSMGNIFKYLSNSKKAKSNKNMAPDGEDKKDDPKDEELNNAEDYMIEVDGNQIPLDQAINKYRETNSRSNVLGPDEVVEIDGQQVPVSELMNMCSEKRDNADEFEGQKPEEVVEEQPSMQNSRVKVIRKHNNQQPEQSNQQTVQNSQPSEPKRNNHYKVVQNAAKKGGEEPEIKVMTSTEKFNRGQERYGSIKAVN